MPPIEAPDDAEPLLRDAFARAQRSLPEAEVPFAAFAARLSQKLEGTDDRAAALRALDLEEIWLAEAIACHERAALAAFERDYLSAIRPVLVPMKLSQANIDEITQLVRKKLLVSEEGAAPRLCAYAGAGKLKSLVRVVAVRTALGLLRAERREQPLDDEPLAAHDVDPELAEIKAQYRGEVKAAFELAVQRLSSRQRNVLRLHLLDGLQVEQIARAYDVHRTSVSRWLAETRAELREHMLASLREKLGLSEPELDSVMRVVHSQLDVSVERVLRSRSAGAAVPR